jgi:hypothetical protein
VLKRVREGGSSLTPTRPSRRPARMTSRNISTVTNHDTSRGVGILRPLQAHKLMRGVEVEMDPGRTHAAPRRTSCS